MSRCAMASQPWGVLQDPAGNALAASATIKNRDGSPATHYSALTGGTSSTASVTFDANGTLRRFIDGGEYLISIPAISVVDQPIDAVSGSVEAEVATKVSRSRVNLNLRDYTDLDGATDNTTAVNDRIADLGALASPTNPKTLYFGEGTLLATHIIPAANVIFNARGCHVKKIGQDGSQAQNCLVRTFETLTGGSYFGTYAGHGIIGGIWDANGWSCPAGLIRSWFGEDTVLDGLELKYTPRLVAGVGTTNLDDVITAPPGTFSAIDVGRPVDGVGIDGGSRIVSVESATSATLDSVATATGTITLTMGTIWGLATGGKGGLVKNCKTREGQLVFQDGSHHCHGSDWLYESNSWHAGDDAMAIGIGSADFFHAAEHANGTLEPITNISYVDNHVQSVRGHAFRIGIQIGETDPVWRISDITERGTHGHVGKERNGAVLLLGGMGSDGGEMIQNVDIDFGSLQVGGPDHDGVGAQAIRVWDSRDVRVAGDLAVEEGSGATGLEGFAVCEVLDSPDVTLDLRSDLAGRYGVIARRSPRLTLGDKMRLTQTSLAQASMPVVALEDCPGARILAAQILDVQDGNNGVSCSTGTTTTLDLSGTTIAHEAGATTGAAVGGVVAALQHLGVDDCNFDGSPAALSAGMLLLPSLKVGDNNRGLSRRRAKLEFYDDFLGDTLDPAWNSRVGTDPQCVAPGIPVIVPGGAMRMTAGDDAAATFTVNGAQLLSSINWTAANGGLVCEVRLRLPTTHLSMCLFAGFTDDVSALRPPFAIGAGDALTVFSNNAVGVLWDTAADTDNWHAVGVKAAAGVKQNLGVAAATNVYDTWRIEVSPAGVATYRRNGIKIGTPLADAITVSTPLAFSISGFARGAVANHHIQAEYVLIEQNRP